MSVVGGGEGSATRGTRRSQERGESLSRAEHGPWAPFAKGKKNRHSESKPPPPHALASTMPKAEADKHNIDCCFDKGAVWLQRRNTPAVTIATGVGCPPPPPRCPCHIGPAHAILGEFRAKWGNGSATKHLRGQQPSKAMRSGQLSTQSNAGSSTVAVLCNTTVPFVLELASDGPGP